VLLVDPGSQDKRARAYSVQHLFADGMVQAPAVEAPDGGIDFVKWADVLIKEASAFRGLSGDEDNLVDSMTQALKYMRDRGFAVRRDEGRAMERARMQDNQVGGKRKALYEV